MEITFVRHGVPDYTLSDQREMSQLEKDYAPLDRSHLTPIYDLTETLDKLGAEIIISSPYTRALQTAEIINRTLNLELFVEHDLREWRADLSGGYIPLTERDRRWAEYRQALKLGKPKHDTAYETHQELRERVIDVLDKYTNYSKVIVVSHFNVFESLAGYQPESIGCAEYRKIKLSECR
tara:strand:- start:2102 stop:2641 length:540 start_codon:yes stop_codon:yes gene_type:complete